VNLTSSNGSNDSEDNEKNLDLLLSVNKESDTQRIGQARHEEREKYDHLSE
jgi:hypothetical protein